MFWARGSQVFPDKPALWDPAGKCTYAELSAAADRVAGALLKPGGPAGRQGASHVAFWVPPSIAYVQVQWGIWRSGQVAVPLCVEHPVPELVHALCESRASILVYADGLAPRLAELKQALGQVAGQLTFVTLAEALASAQPAAQALPLVDESWLSRPAQILFTSGTTGKPKAAVATHSNLESGVRTLISAWGWGPRDHTLGVLPLHHTHGIINVLSCALAAGASIELFEKFDAVTIWDRLVRPRDGARVTLFMAVPTVYSKLMDAHSAQGELTRLLWSDAAKKLRLWVSGSAALPVSMLEAWRALTGHTLLERYGMTEIGMALSNPLAGERRAGTVGLPLPGVEVRLSREGEIEVRGPTVFAGYFGREEQTRECFTEDGWFKTGDQASRDKEGYYKILGRSSVDIIKTGGYKVSALEIEEELRVHPLLLDVAVVGVPDAEWGERVAAAYTVRPGHKIGQLELAAWARQRLARYKVPTLWRECSALPRNVMGKVTKPEIKKLFGT